MYLVRKVMHVKGAELLDDIQRFALHYGKTLGHAVQKNLLKVFVYYFYLFLTDVLS